MTTTSLKKPNIKPWGASKRPCMVRGEYYESINEAARMLDIDRSIIRIVCNSDDPMYEDCYWV